ncbi:TlpA family protein disulfide reductase [Corynebacterium aquatimens]|uniref:Thiol-disulfide isomerase/thioredoxin n=1 Tax=Corynebacterium aquatimens TaxID=1190508 RepID=A0A931DY81_9CORY|nr:TlpA disulfide reductase family protein [Corynebacterium aquatimens]MBG6122537.1 thiol-disulfide isomerase/thioredoxin [Corynebacterium aquatimens]WJY64923.1 Thiol:disulfide interchange protein TlpA [Corynebacterium aquatimens]
MKKTAVASALALVVATALVVAAAIWLLGPGGETPGDASRQGARLSTTGEVPVPDRPECPSTSVGGVELECLGAKSAGDASDDRITVANVWAWWCQPCRDELPALDAVARQRPEWTVVGVHADRDPAAGANLLNEMGVGLASYSDTSGAFAGALGLPGVVPVTVVFRGEEKLAVFPEPFVDAPSIIKAVEDAIKEDGR